MDKVKIFSPATIANISCGFDVLGLALNEVGDEMHFTKKDAKGVSISKIEGAELPFKSTQNVASVVATVMLEKTKANFGVDIELYKQVKPGSGLGSSASSAAGAAFAINEMLGKPFSKIELVEFARIGEVIACGSPIADNVSAAIYGGIVLIKSLDPLEIIKLPVPKELWVTVIHPQIEIKTKDARVILPNTVNIADAVKQSANLAGLVSALYTKDYQLISRSLVDVIAEPYRKKLIPHFESVKMNALENGALGVGIAGSGPSIFALSKGKKTAINVAEGMRKVYQNIHIDFNIFFSSINNYGVKIVE